MRKTASIAAAVALATALGLAGCTQMGGPDNSTAGPVPCGSGGPANCIPSPVASGGGGGTADSQGWTRHQVSDTGMPAFTLPVPPGWQAQSEMVWTGNGRCAAGNPSAMIRMVSGDGRSQIEYLHGFLVSNYSDPFARRGAQASENCIIGTVTSGEQMVRDVIVPRLRQGWNIEAITPVQVPQSIAQIVQISQGGPGRAQGYAFQVQLGSPDGSQAEQMYVAGMIHTVDAMGTGIAPPVMNMAGLVWAARGPRDQVAGLYQVGEQIRAALQYNPEYQARMNEHNRKMQDINRPTYSPIRPTTPYNPASPTGPRRENFPGERSGEIQHEDTIDGIREVQRCYDPETGRTVEVSIHAGPCAYSR